MMVRQKPSKKERGVFAGKIDFVLKRLLHEVHNVRSLLEAAMSDHAIDAFAKMSHFDAGFETDYIATEGELRRVDLAVDEVTRGETGNGFPATLTLTDAAQERWEAGCMANVSTHELVSGNDYKIVGTGSCSAPATSQSSATNVTVGDFAFVTVVNWTQ